MYSLEILLLLSSISFACSSQSNDTDSNDATIKQSSISESKPEKKHLLH